MDEQQQHEPGSDGPGAPLEARAVGKAVDVSVIVVNWNTLGLLRDCLRSIEAQKSNLSCDVIVVDNGSTDGSADMVEAEFPNVHLIRNQVNRGYAPGNNQGLAVAGGRYALLLNSDTVLLDSAIEKSVAFAESHPEAAVVGCRTIYPDGRLQHNCLLFPSLLNLALSLTYLARLFPRNRFFGRARLTWWDYESPREVDAVAGCFMLVRRCAIDEVGPMSESFFMYCEEFEWCWRFRRAGWRVVYTPDAVIVHLVAASSAQCASEMRVLQRRSVLMLLEQRSGKPARFIANAMFLTTALARLAVLGVQRVVGGSAAAGAARQWPQGVATLRFHLSGHVPALR
jgi:GT2 family glycosyltransferase